jgi:cytochrome c-type biogenesis protein CcmH/NrfF
MTIILYGAIVIVIVIGTIIFSRISAKKLTETEEEKDYSIDEDDDEDTGVIE